MNKTLKISFALKNTYRVNSILYSLKQIPLIKKVLPDKVYQMQEFKLFANVISVLWEIVSTFLGKFLYFMLMIVGAGTFYKGVPDNQIFLHILLFLSMIGAFANTFMFNPSKDKYYAMILMRMNAKEYALIHYVYSILKLLVGFLTFSVIFGLMENVPLWICILIPFSIAGMKITMAAYSLREYEKSGKITNENGLGKLGWTAILVFLLMAYGLPALKIMIPVSVVSGIMLVSVVCGVISMKKLFDFNEYKEMYQEILTKSMIQINEMKNMTKQVNQKSISADVTITSKRKGFEYLNELFIKRHQKILWKSSKRIALISFCVALGFLVLVYLVPESRKGINSVLLTFLPYFVFIMYAINRGTGFTNALFMNCDHSLLTYSFYKQPDFVLKLFQIRLREIIKVNLLPASVIGTGLAVLLYVSGGTDNPLNYAVIIVSILCMSIFFSVHYLTVYYLLQPYNVGTEMKSAAYQIVLSVTYLVCFFMMKLKMPTFIFGMVCIVFCVLYGIAACALIYKFAPKTFKLRA